MLSGSDSPAVSLKPVLYLVRHGETDCNLKKIFQGRRDVPLNSNGIRQAHVVKEILKTVALTRAFVSPLSRARETAEIILAGREIPVEIEPRLIELDFGAWDGVAEAEVKERWPAQYLDYRTDLSRFQPEGGESARDAQLRAGEWWDEVSGRFPSPHENLLVVSHQSLNAVLGCYVVGSGLDKAWDTFKTKPGEVIRIVCGAVPLVTRIGEDSR